MSTGPVAGVHGRLVLGAFQLHRRRRWCLEPELLVLQYRQAQDPNFYPAGDSRDRPGAERRNIRGRRLRL